MKTTTRDIITRPTQLFEQGEIGEAEFETPIQFQAYNDVISIEQDGEQIRVMPEAVEAFIKALRNFKKQTYQP